MRDSNLPKFLVDDVELFQNIISDRSSANAVELNRSASSGPRSSGPNTLPWAMRRRMASGEMSTSSIWSVRARNSSGTVFSGARPTMSSTGSVSEPMCCTVTVVITSMPASSSASTSCQRCGRGADTEL